MNYSNIWNIWMLNQRLVVLMMRKSLMVEYCGLTHSVDWTVSRSSLHDSNSPSLMKHPCGREPLLAFNKLNVLLLRYGSLIHSTGSPLNHLQHDSILIQCFIYFRKKTCILTFTTWSWMGYTNKIELVSTPQ